MSCRGKIRWGKDNLIALLLLHHPGAHADLRESSSHTRDLWRPQWSGLQETLFQDVSKNGGEVPAQRPRQEVRLRRWCLSLG